MADDQGTKTTSIDNLINELTKQKSSQSAASPVNPPAVSMPNPPFPPKPVSPSVPSMSATNPSVPSNLPIAQMQPAMPKLVIPPIPTPIPKPVMPPPFIFKPAPQPTPAVPPVKPPVSPSSPVKEYQSSIRTMSEDLSSLKTGQKPSGVSVPRIIEPLKPPIVAPPALSKPPISPVMPGIQVKLGELQKTGPMAQQKVPVSAPMPKKEEPSRIIIPEGGKKTIGGNLLYIGITAIVVLVGVVYWFFVIRNPAIPEAIFMPTPSVTPTPVATLNQLLSEALPVDIELSESANPLIDFNEAVKAQTISGGTTDKLNIKIHAEGTELAVTDRYAGGLTDIFDKFLISYPAQLKTILGSETAVLLYGQKEAFTAKGLPDTSAINVKKLIFITEINDFAMAASISKEWEPTMADGLRGIFELDVKKAASKTFLSSLYRETNVKYINFAYPDKTIDYAIVLASNGKAYLVVSSSREAIYGVIDKLK